MTNDEIVSELKEVKTELESLSKLLRGNGKEGFFGVALNNRRYIKWLFVAMGVLLLGVGGSVPAIKVLATLAGVK